MFRRIDAFQPTVNAYAYQLREEALVSARQADEATAYNTAEGVFHGVPINVKESFGVRVQPCTWGIPELKDSKAPADAAAVQRLRNAGAILLGATNVPLHLMDDQTFNDIYGTSTNPWDIERTPGGSSGGSAASLAAGMAFLSLGSDVAGSVRKPASFCGIYGHKPTLDVVSLRGHAPGGVHYNPGFSTLLAVAGPMARTAGDLEAELRVLAGPEYPASKAFTWTLPKARHRKFRDYRIGYIFEDPSVPVSAETKSVLESAIEACERAGATLVPGWPPDCPFQELLETYLFLLGALNFSVMPPEQQEKMRDHLTGASHAYAQGALSSFSDWQKQNFKRLAYRFQWEKHFESIDVFLLPTAITAAFPHDHRSVETRTIPFPEGGTRPYWDLLAYTSPASLTGCPATVAPAGLSRSGLPVGVQIVGPYLEDATTIRFAQLLAREIGGFRPPDGYRSFSSSEESLSI